MTSDGGRDPHRLGDDLDLPLEPTSGELLDYHVHWSGGVVVLSSTIDVPGAGKKPALVFRFASPTGEFYTPIVLVADDDQMAKLDPLISGAVDLARRAAAG